MKLSEWGRKVGASLQPRLGALFLLGFTILAFLGAPRLDWKSEEYLNRNLTQTLEVYGMVRLINGAVSVLKHSTAEVSAGVVSGSLAVGEILDPLDDATERFSDLLTIAIWSLLGEKTIYEVGKIFPLLLIAVAIGILYFIFPQISLLRTILIFLLLVRLFLPFSAIVSSYLDSIYFNPQIEEVQTALRQVVPQSEQPQLTGGEEGGFFARLKSSLHSVESNIQQLRGYLKESQQIIHYLIELGGLLLGRFLLQALLLPLLFYWLLKQFVPGKEKG